MYSRLCFRTHPKQRDCQPGRETIARPAHWGLRISRPVSLMPGSDCPVSFWFDCMILEGLALRGHAIAQCHLGEMIEDGLTPQPKDGPSMTWWYAQAAAQGYPEAQYALGRCHLMDDERLDLAMFWFELAARNGHGDAIAML
ncbi:uncharacterized protein BJ171DRAFT_87177 [Polychytrium aggregatum]|uniref:uncharacterized protein n=1 Tax=Polychytrium aggregatum TaxID=110093 RepID=UPI0022FF1707|nr:uncharacterized protein BJ171DRAFT_87177 [Polychytrium aggregatum]KAI9190565.1 hypothetical protein BJ171DRAFT_87177 [Polychytrium aggregatum]